MVYQVFLGGCHRPVSPLSTCAVQGAAAALVAEGPAAALPPFFAGDLPAFLQPFALLRLVVLAASTVLVPTVKARPYYLNTASLWMAVHVSGDREGGQALCSCSKVFSCVLTCATQAQLTLRVECQVLHAWRDWLMPGPWQSFGQTANPCMLLIIIF